MGRSADIALVCGLGNSGADYAHTRHNAGFAVVDAVARRADVPYWKDRCGCLVAPCVIAGHDVLVVKPQGYMNTSGGPLAKLMRAEGIAADELLVIHDEVDLAAGAVRTKLGGGLNAHNGLRSVAAKLGTRDFARVQVGIGRPPGRMGVAEWTLRQLKGSFSDDFAVTVEQAADMVERCVGEGLAGA